MTPSGPERITDDERPPRTPLALGAFALGAILAVAVGVARVWPGAGLSAEALVDLALVVALLTLLGTAALFRYGTQRIRHIDEAAVASVQEREKRLALIVNNTSDLIFLMRILRDPDGRVTGYVTESVNTAYHDVTGLAPEDVLGRRVEEVLSPEHAAYVLTRYEQAVRTSAVLRFEERLTLPTRTVLLETVLAPIADGRGLCTHLLGTARDVTDRRRAEKALQELATRDDLTGVLNRRGFRELVEQEIKVARRTGRVDALCYLDLDEFKPINDEHGHAEGDHALCVVADALRATVRDADIVARLGGDEFVVYAPGLTAAGEGVILARRLERVVRQGSQTRLSSEGKAYRIGCSVGVAELQPNEGFDELLARADAMLYANKVAGRLARESDVSRIVRETKARLRVSSEYEKVGDRPTEPEG